MQVGASVWYCDTDSDEAWILAIVTSRTDEELCVQPVDRPDVTISCPAQDSPRGTNETKYRGVQLANDGMPDKASGGSNEDLTMLPYLNEPAILHSISQRFHEDKIYTWTGAVLIAVNPFKHIPAYSNDILDSYRSNGLQLSMSKDADETRLAPHVFAVADKAFHQMTNRERRSQSILISGESGAGKTESTKYVVQYLTALGSSGTSEVKDEPSIMDRVLQSNPILEAFGNARTLRNDNSSRFGKFVDLGFSANGNLLGAKVQTYLLERVRLVSHSQKERNYHIFYQLLRGATDEQKERFDFTQESQDGDLASCFHFTGQGGAPRLREFSDEEAFQCTLKAMKSLGWSDDRIESVLSLVAGLLHMGQISFKSEEDGNGVATAVIANEEKLKASARLLGVEQETLKTAMTVRVLVARGQEIRTPHSADKAADARDALAKTIYAALFLWLVEQVNKSIRWKEEALPETRTIGVLDIFGFECFAVNSFEQLCINFTNEALQQQFNNYVFKMEEAMYKEEQIEWELGSFTDNQDCLDVIQAPRNGIFALLDDELRLPRGSDINWAKRMYKHLLPLSDDKTGTRFCATPVQQAKGIFCVNHFAGPVNYSAQTGFVEKNKNEIPWTAQHLFQTATSELMSEIYSVQRLEDDSRGKPATRPGNAPKKKKAETVSGQFKEQLSRLIKNIDQSDPHYIRCLKPNDEAKPGILVKARLRDQLRTGGVLEAIRVARNSYPVRLTLSGFFQRYRMLLPSSQLPWQVDDQRKRDLCMQMLELLLQPTTTAGVVQAESATDVTMNITKEDIQIGISKVFLKKASHDTLEAHRSFHHSASSTLLQRWVRGRLQRRAYSSMKSASLNIQKVFRGFVQRKRYLKLLTSLAGEKLTNNCRMLLMRSRYHRMKRGFVLLQAVWRLRFTMIESASVKIQTQARLWKRRVEYRLLKTSAQALQRCIRAFLTEKKEADLKRESKERLLKDCKPSSIVTALLHEEGSALLQPSLIKAGIGHGSLSENEEMKEKSNPPKDQLQQLDDNRDFINNVQHVGNHKPPKSIVLRETNGAKKSDEVDTECDEGLFETRVLLRDLQEDNQRLRKIIKQSENYVSREAQFSNKGDGEKCNRLEREALTTVRARFLLLLFVVTACMFVPATYLLKKRHAVDLALTTLLQCDEVDQETWKIIDDALFSVSIMH